VRKSATQPSGTVPVATETGAAKTVSRSIPLAFGLAPHLRTADGPAAEHCATGALGYGAFVRSYFYRWVAAMPEDRARTVCHPGSSRKCRWPLG
jgi:hypothetical protein